MRIAVVTVPYSTDIGRWGNARSPGTLIGAGLLDRLREQGHEVAEPVVIELPRAERTRDAVTNLGRIAHRQSQAVAAALQDPGTVVMVLGGNCTHAPGAAGGVVRALGGCGVAWFDAHGDMNTMATTTSGMWGGMPYAVMLGWDLDDWRESAGLTPAIAPEAAALIGTSDLDEGEVAALRSHPLAHLDARQISGDDVEAVIAAALGPRAGAAPAWYLHMDPDVAGPEAVPGGHTPAPYWPPRDKILRAVAETARRVNVRAFNPGFVDPGGDPEGRAAAFCIDVALTVVDAMRERGR